MMSPDMARALQTVQMRPRRQYNGLSLMLLSHHLMKEVDNLTAREYELVIDTIYVALNDEVPSMSVYRIRQVREYTKEAEHKFAMIQLESDE